MACCELVDPLDQFLVPQETIEVVVVEQAGHDGRLRSRRMIRDDILVLPDARTLTYTTIGAGDGPVVWYQHGAPGGRLELLGLDDAFATAGLRVVTTDRPGYGGSTPDAGRTVADWTRDVVALADHVGAERFGVIGLSSGGPYAVACAALLGDRVVGAVIAAGNTDMSWPDAGAGYLESELEIMALDDTDAAVARCIEHYGHDGARFFDGEMDLGPTDDAWLADETNATALMTAMHDAFRHGVVGYAHDIWVQGRAWSFDPATITCPVIVAHGEDDHLVPIAHSRHTASLIPSAQMRVLPGVGHLSLVDEFSNLATEIMRLA
jgi:pimeloyl-ACP methyl ester carboxylesterase